MNTKLRTAALAALAVSGFAVANEYGLLVRKVAAASKLRDYKNKQIENDLCMSSKNVVSAVATDDPVQQDACKRQD
jgi:L-aminopeptidase/D-esterase-like protein